MEQLIGVIVVGGIFMFLFWTLGEVLYAVWEWVMEHIRLQRYHWEERKKERMKAKKLK